MTQELIIPDGDWRRLLSLTEQTPTHINIMCLNAVPDGAGGLNRWLSRTDVLDLLRSEAARLESRDIATLADRIAEATRRKA
ncbi:MAG: hypothetical protein DWQ40_00465 [Actinobacteria bacterium]|nr:MAG: hypothetical protein DWQ40_00465 [Actinomycetota bacterium]REK34102.1 MAG: hypothetical protein DWQ20_07025 [Actinomycetota bacterium]